MDQPQQEWWVVLLKWLDFNKTTFIISGLAYRFIERFFGFLTKLIDGRLKKVADIVIAEKTKELDLKMAKLDERLNNQDDKLDRIINSLIGKK